MAKILLVDDDPQAVLLGGFLRDLQLSEFGLAESGGGTRRLCLVHGQARGIDRAILGGAAEENDAGLGNMMGDGAEQVSGCGHMQAIHGGKAKNDKIDAHKIAVLLRGGMLPQAYVYPAEMRATRDLLRRRLYLTRKRAELLTHVQNTNSQYNLPEIGKKIAYKANRDGVAERFPEPAVQKRASQWTSPCWATTTSSSATWSDTSSPLPSRTGRMRCTSCAPYLASRKS